MMETAAGLPTAVFLMGPTASGKTDLAVALREQLPFELISVDSALVYRGMDIGTAKPDAALLARAPHRLIDIREPNQPYSAAEFRDDALREMVSIVAAGRIPLLVGGTMLYFRALEHGLSALPTADPVVRERLERLAAELGWEAMHARLAEVDPVAAARIHCKDPQRIQRALEVYEISGRPMSELQAAAARERLPYRLIKLALVPQDRALLHRRIEQRFLQMLRAGFIDEVVRLRARGDLRAEMPSMRSVGYRQVWEYLDGDYDYDEMTRRGVAASRQLAKRQLTWLRSDHNVSNFLIDETNLFDRVLKSLGRALI